MDLRGPFGGGIHPLPFVIELTSQPRCLQQHSPYEETSNYLKCKKNSLVKSLYDCVFTK